MNFGHVMRRGNVLLHARYSAQAMRIYSGFSLPQNTVIVRMNILSTCGNNRVCSFSSTSKSTETTPNTEKDTTFKEATNSTMQAKSRSTTVRADEEEDYDSSNIDPDKLDAYLQSKAAYQARQEEKLRNVFSKLRSTAGTMAGSSQGSASVDPYSSFTAGRRGRPGQGADVNDRVRAAMEYKREKEKIKQHEQKEKAHEEELKQIEQETTSTKKWFSRWF